MGLPALRVRRKSVPRPRPRHDRQLEAAGLTLAVKVSENRQARRMILRIAAGGRTLKVTIPPHVNDRDVDAFIARNRSWVAARLSQLPETVMLGEGASIPFRGAEHEIVHLDRLRGVVEARSIGGKDSLLVPGEPAHVGRKIVEFLKKQARLQLGDAVGRHAKALGVRPASMRITDTTSRWGSCSTARTLSFSWRIVMAPPEVLDYLAAHEVAHLKEMNHSDAFWAIVRGMCPHMERHKSWLKRHGPRLHAVSLHNSADHRG